MLRNITVSNDMLKWIADELNKHVEQGEKITRGTLSKLLWRYETNGKFEKEEE